MKPGQPKHKPVRDFDNSLVADVVALLEQAKPVRLDFDGGRIHVDRALPFLCVFVAGKEGGEVARDIATANASYLISPDHRTAELLSEAVGAAMTRQYGSFLIIDIGELDRDTLLTEDAPHLPPFEITLSATGEAAVAAASIAFSAAVESVEAKYRCPRILTLHVADDPHARFGRLGFPCLTVRFAPIYRVPGTDDTYPELRGRLVANFVDAGLHAVAAFAETQGVLKLTTHRALGRNAFVDAVVRADRAVDDVAASFDILLAVTPINAEKAWQEFEWSAFKRLPRFLYRPLTVRVDIEKRKLFSIAMEGFEDPMLIDLYREKQKELDLQLSLLAEREGPRFIHIGRALYGDFRPNLIELASGLLESTADAETSVSDRNAEIADCLEVRDAARAMVAAYQAEHPDFGPQIELRDDLPPGLMVSGPRLLISRQTRMPRARIEALLSHEIGVHLLTYFNGSVQGLRLFRSGLAGYERAQEGLAVFAEYLAGGLSRTRLRLLAARVVACAGMLDGASFQETFRTLVRDYGFGKRPAFDLTFRLYRGGGLPKDAIYLDGLVQILEHVGKGGSLDPYWMGKIASSHFDAMQELAVRGLLRPPAIKPMFLSHPTALRNLEKAQSGLTPAELIAS